MKKVKILKQISFFTICYRVLICTEGRIEFMNLNQLKYFLAIVKTGSFSNAADDMYISQSSMSKQIKALKQNWVSISSNANIPRSI